MGRSLQELVNNGKFKTASMKRGGGRLREVPTKRFCVLDR